MKKIFSFIKVFVIVLLVLATIGGTAYFFYSNIHYEPNAQNEVKTYAFSGGNLTLRNKILIVSGKAKEKGNSNLEQLIYTNDNLNDILYALNSYLVGSDMLDNKLLAELNAVKSAQSTTTYYVNQYEDKSMGGSFDEARGADIVFKNYANYLLKLTNLLQEINLEYSSVLNMDGDIKFSMIELYLNICNETLQESNISDRLQYANLVERDNLDAIEGEKSEPRFKLKNSFLDVANQFNSVCNDFIKYYKLSNKQNLASNFSEIVESVGSEISLDYSNEQNCAVCFKTIYGI